MRPRDPDGKPAPRRLVLSMARGAGSTGTVFRLAESDGTTLVESAAPTAAIERFVQMRKDDASPFLKLSFADALPVIEVGRLCALLAVLETMGAVRIEPPAADQLYYGAFVPDKSWFDPAGRPTQPWELHLARTNGTVSGKMLLNEPVWSDESPTPTYKRIGFDVADPKAVRARLDADTAERQAAGKTLPPRVLLVFVAAGFNYGETLAFIRPALTTHGTVYILVEE